MFQKVLMAVLMEKNRLIKNHGIIYRFFAVDADDVLLINCIKKVMPYGHLQRQFWWKI